MGTSGFASRVREVRLRAGLSQLALAARVGLSRQALSAVEAGRTVPGTDVALKLAAALDASVEALFQPARAPTRVEARWAIGSAPALGDRVLLSVGPKGVWIARALERRAPEGLQAADGVVVHRAAHGGLIELLGTPDRAAQRLVVMGCAPALGLLAGRLASAPQRVAVAWLHGTSGEALDALSRDEVHLAGVHLRDARSGRFNLPQVKRRFAGPMLVVNFAEWEQGLVVAKGNPLKIRSVKDLRRPGIRLVHREPGAGATKLLEQLLGGRPVKRSETVARGHLEVAQAVAQGGADVGIAIGSVALAWGLDFVPLCAERFDLVFPKALAGDARVERLVEELGAGSFRREVESLGGYDMRASGTVLG